MKPEASINRSPGNLRASSDSPNYVSEKVSCRHLHGLGNDVVAIQAIKEGEVIALYGGVFLHREYLPWIATNLRRYFYQVTDEIWFGSQDCDHVGTAEYINHSCTPNCGFAGIYKIIALRDIPSGESITIDYMSLQSEYLQGSTFDCYCGSPNCRRKVRPSDWKSMKPTDALAQFAQPFIQAKIGCSNSKYAQGFSQLCFPSKWKCEKTDGEISSIMLSAAVQWNGTTKPVAQYDIAQNEVVLITGGRVVAEKQMETMDPAAKHTFRPLEPGYWLGPLETSPSRQLRDVPHTDHGNLEFQFGMLLVSRHGIAKGEELSINISAH